MNVCIYRIPKRKFLVSSRSLCPSCNNPIPWYDNIPVLSYVLLKGRCRFCKQKISLRYPVVELITGYFFLHLTYFFIFVRQESPAVLFVYILLCCALLIATFVDLELQIIPNEVTFIGIPLFLLLSVLVPELHDAQNTLRSFFLTGVNRLDSFFASLIGVAVGGGIIYLCLVFGRLILKKDAMGFGDVKLMGMVGGCVGWKLSIAIFFVAPFFGLLMAIPVLLLKKRNLIPYGPFLSVATLVCILMQDTFIKFIDLYAMFFTVLFTGFR